MAGRIPLLALLLVVLLPLAQLSAPEPLGGQEEVTLGRPIPGPVVPPAYFLGALQRGTRSQDGSPGPNYWQVYSEYDIDVSLDPETGNLSGSETIRFHNRSPLELRALQLFLHQNIHAEGVARNRAVEVTGGVRLEGVQAEGVELSPLRQPSEPGYAVDGGVMTLLLPEPVRSGESVELAIDWSFLVPQNGAGRMGHSNREMYFLAYWFPKIAVLDDLRGWDAESYQGAEFYEGYGDYDVRITVPYGWTVMATGTLENPEEVYTLQTRERMAEALAADTMVQIATRADRENGSVTLSPENGSLTYAFHAENVRDFTWTASDTQLWTGTSSRVPDRDGDGAEDRVAIHSFWREYRAPLWEDQALYAKHSIEYESLYTGFTYPWPHMTSVEGADIIGGGMEFPMFTLMGSYQGREPVDLYNVTAHELGHMWVPMIVGANEKRHAWIDEGATTFLENQTKTDYWPNLPDPDAQDMQSYLRVAAMGMEQSMMRHGDYYEPGPGYGNASYQKPASLLVTLRSLLGEETFMEAYQTFIREWSFKHPSPWDFFNTFERFAGVDLDWFWQSFYYETWALDQAVESVEREGFGTVITVADRGFAFMPTRLSIQTSSGDVLTEEIPVGHWLSGETTVELQLPSSVGEVVRVEIDPEGRFPDVDRRNNVWERR